MTQAAGHRDAARPRPGSARRHAVRDALTPASGSTSPARPSSAWPRWCTCSARSSAGPGLPHGRRRPAHDVPAAPRRRGKNDPAAAALLRQPSHGDILSRVTNDIDNLTTTLQQGLSQLLTSMLTIVGVLGMMFWISPLLAAVSLVIDPAGDRGHPPDRAPFPGSIRGPVGATGTLNGLVEETHTGHALVQVFGRRKATMDEFAGRTGACTRRASARSSCPASSSRPCSSWAT